jgi:hypothetical protein
MGNPAYTYWICVNCEKEFSYDVEREIITGETTAARELLDTINGTNKTIIIQKER